MVCSVSVSVLVGVGGRYRSGVCWGRSIVCMCGSARGRLNDMHVNLRGVPFLHVCMSVC